MITEGQRVAQSETALKEELTYLEDVVKASKKYEILVTYKEFNDYREDYRNLIKLHDEEIKGYHSILSGTTNFLKKMRATDSLVHHLIRKEEVESFLNYPEKIISGANEARERIAVIKEQLGLTPNKEPHNA